MRLLQWTTNTVGKPKAWLLTTKEGMQKKEELSRCGGFQGSEGSSKVGCFRDVRICIGSLLVGRLDVSLLFLCWDGYSSYEPPPSTTNSTFTRVWTLSTKRRWESNSQWTQPSRNEAELFKADFSRVTWCPYCAGAYEECRALGMLFESVGSVFLGGKSLKQPTW